MDHASITPNLSIVAKNPEVSGFPFNLRIHIKKVRIVYKNTIILTWTAKNLNGTIRPWNFRKFVFESPVNTVMYSRENSSPKFILKTQAAKIIGRHVSYKKLSLLQIMITKPILNISQIEKIYTANNLFFSLNNAVSDTDQNNTIFHLSITAFDGPVKAIKAIGSPITLQNMQISIPQKFPKGTLTESVAKWRDNGGIIELKNLLIVWGMLHLDINGTITLDDKFRPVGALTSVTSGFDEFVDKLSEREIITPTQGAIGKITSKVVGEQIASKRTRIPITVQFGKLSIGPLTIANIPSLEPIIDQLDHR